MAYQSGWRQPHGETGGMAASGSACWRRETHQYRENKSARNKCISWRLAAGARQLQYRAAYRRVGAMAKAAAIVAYQPSKAWRQRKCVAAGGQLSSGET